MKLSVITVNYNNAAELQRTFQSVAEQSFTDFEYLVIDGGSTDDSINQVKAYAAHIDYWISEPDGGIYDAMNKGISQAKGDYCLFLNAGDTLNNEHSLRDAAACLNHDFVCGSAQLVYANASAAWNPPTMVDELFFRRRYSICHQALFIRTRLLKNRPYRTCYRIAADFEQIFYEVVVNKASYAAIGTVICNYDMSGVSANAQRSDEEKKRIVRLFEANGWIAPDELVSMVEDLKVGSRKYKLIGFLVRMALKFIKK